MAALIKFLVLATVLLLTASYTYGSIEPLSKRITPGTRFSTNEKKCTTKVQESTIFCSKKNGCATFDGWQVDCESVLIPPLKSVGIFKAFEAGSHYFIHDKFFVSENALELNFSPEDSTVKKRPPKGKKPPDPCPFFNTPWGIRRDLLRFPLCTRIFPGLFRKGRFIPFGVPFGLKCGPKSLVKNQSNLTSTASNSISL